MNVKKILAVISATYAVAKRKPEKIRLAGIRTLTSAIPVQPSAIPQFSNKGLHRTSHRWGEGGDQPLHRTLEPPLGLITALLCGKQRIT